FYKLTPDGKLKWSYRNPDSPKEDDKEAGFGVPTAGFANAALVTDDTVYVGDIGGFIYALSRADGKERWKVNTRARPFPGEHTFHFGPSTSSVWATPSYDAESGLIFFGTDAHNAPRQPTKDDPRLYTKHSCAVIAVEARTGAEKWVTQINKGDVWNYAMRAY